MKCSKDAPAFAGVIDFCVYRARHAALVFEASRASSETLPRDTRAIGNHHFGGTPRSGSRHFLRAEGAMPSISAASSTSRQSNVVFMPKRFRDKSSPRQGTDWAALGDGPSLMLGCMGKKTDPSKVAASLSNYYLGFCARTKMAREQMAQGWSMQQMAQRLGIGYSAYKKYETRTPLPHHLIPVFCDFTNTTLAFLMGDSPEVRMVAPRKTPAKRRPAKKNPRATNKINEA